jgi:hypothetical protein
MARAAHFVNSEKDFDCYIFGASRVGMMNEHRFSDHKCFMVSFANATPQELLAFASYMNHRNGRDPSLVIVGVDDFSIVGPAEGFDVPKPVLENTTPYFWQYYFSADVARWSMETLLDISPKPRYYGGDLTGRIRDDAESLTILRAEGAPRRSVNHQIIQEYSKFREAFPNARLVAYATPVAVQRIVQYRDAEILPYYLTGLIETARYFDEMYDFSIPSIYTMDPTLTYDGSHFQPSVNDRIVESIQNREPGFGIIISELDVHEISAVYAERLKALKDSDSP